MYGSIDCLTFLTWPVSCKVFYHENFNNSVSNSATLSGRKVRTLEEKAATPTILPTSAFSLSAYPLMLICKLLHALRHGGGGGGLADPVHGQSAFNSSCATSPRSPRVGAKKRSVASETSVLDNGPIVPVGMRE